METPKLSPIVIDGLQYLNKTISLDLTKKLICNAVKMALHSDENIPANPEIYASKPDYAKQSVYAVTTVLFLATKYNMDNYAFRTFLEGHNVQQLALDEIISEYEKNRSKLLIKCITTGHSLPHCTSVEWKMTCDVKTSRLDDGSGNLTYQISLGRYKEKTGERESIANFVCNVEELQSLIGRLSEIERHCLKLAENPI